MRELAGQNPYRLLGVAPTASDDEIRAARRRLLKRYHPDRPDGDLHAAQDVTAAAAMLLDPRRRQIYDLYAAGRPTGTPAGADSRWFRAPAYIPPTAPSCRPASFAPARPAAATPPAAAAASSAASRPPTSPAASPPPASPTASPPPAARAYPSRTARRRARKATRRRQRRTAVLSLLAVVVSVVFGPAGLFIGLASLHRAAPRTGERLLARAAIAIGSVWVVFAICSGASLVLAP
jgi:curved DNA-binding protein CbpA